MGEQRQLDERLSGITAEGITDLEKRLDRAGVPREEYSGQVGGVCAFTFWGRIHRLLDYLAAAEPRGEERIDESSASWQNGYEVGLAHALSEPRGAGEGEGS